MDVFEADEDDEDDEEAEEEEEEEVVGGLRHWPLPEVVEVVEYPPPIPPPSASPAPFVLRAPLTAYGP